MQKNGQIEMVTTDTLQTTKRLMQRQILTLIIDVHSIQKVFQRIFHNTPGTAQL